MVYADGIAWGQIMIVFVACNYVKMPFIGYRDAFRTVAAQNPDVEFVFADAKITQDTLLNKIVHHIRTADCGLYDITFWNPNVLLELGIAVGMDKPRHLLFNPNADQQSLWKFLGVKQGGSRIPSDLEGYERVEYTDMRTLVSGLERWIASQKLHNNPNQAGHWTNLKDRVDTTIRDNPGLLVGEIGSRLGLEIPAVQIAIRHLVKQGTVVKNGRGPGTRYFWQSASARPARKSQGASLRNAAS